MRKPITRNMCEEFNDVLAIENSAVRVSYQQDSSVRIHFVQDIYINHESTTLYPSEKLINKIRDFFVSKGVERVEFNHTHTFFWALYKNIKN